MKHAKRFLDIVHDVKRRIRQTDVKTVRARQTQGDPFYLVDVREDTAWE